MPTVEHVQAVSGGHLWVAALISVAVLALATLTVCGFNLDVVRTITLGADERASTSKFQAALWTYVVCFALLTLLVGHLGYDDWNDGWNRFLEEGLNPDYLWLLGIPATGLVGAKAITQTKVTSNPASKTMKQSHDGTLATRVRELVSDDNDDTPKASLSDLQYVVFNLIAIAYFLAAFLAHPEAGLPSLPDTLIALTGVSAGTYLATKAATSATAPTIVSVVPSRFSRAKATELVVRGTGYLRPPGTTGGGATPSVTLDGVELPVIGDPTDTELTATFPAGSPVQAGKVPLVVYSPTGVPSKPVQLDVEA